MRNIPTAISKRFTVRPPVSNDIPAIIELMMALDLAHYGVADKYSSEDILADWDALDLSADAWVIIAANGRLAAYGDVTDEGSGHLRADGYVHPEFTRQGLGTLLVHLTEARAYELISHAPDGPRVSLTNSVLQSDTAAHSILELAGYQLVRGFWRMAIDLDEPPPAPVWPSGITLETFAYGQERAVFDAVQEAFQDHWGHVPRKFTDWVEHTKRESFDPTLWFLAMDGGEIAGVTLCRLRPDGSGWINTVGVRRPWRRLGLGATLLRAAFGEFYRRQVAHLGLSVDAQNLTGATRLYERAGMHVSLRIAVYEKELRSGKELATNSLPEAE
ncbi:MAG: GNAT family N-acetyltransferase [Ktedonobacterales bacterium]